MDSNITGLQAVWMIGYRPKNGSRTRIGVYGGLPSLSATTGTTTAGTASAASGGDGYVGALYASHDNAAGWYADAVLQGTWLDATAGAASAKSRGWLASLEAGQTLALTDTSWLEPQAQVIYGRNSMGPITDSAGVVTTYAGDDVLIGRVGMRLKSTQELANGSIFTGWLKTDLWGDAHAKDQSVAMTGGAGSTSMALARKQVWADVGLGFDLQASADVTLFADGDMSVGLDRSFQSFAGKAGVRLGF
ncbi:MAG: autotransporter domain-containing protein [Hyphomicrobiales bacterium]